MPLVMAACSHFAVYIKAGLGEDCCGCRLYLKFQCFEWVVFSHCSEMLLCFVPLPFLPVTVLGSDGKRGSYVAV